MRADIRCKWTPLSLQGEHFITTILWIPDGSPLEVRLRVVENLLAIILIPVTVPRPFCDPKFSGRWIEGKTKAWTIWILWKRTLGDLASCHTSTSCMLLLIYMTSELNIKCLWRHPATSFHLEITKIQWSEVSGPIVNAAHCLTPLQRRNGKIPTKARTEVLTNLLSALQEFTKFPHFENTHPFTKHLVKELICQCQCSVSDDQATSPKRNKTIPN